MRLRPSLPLALLLGALLLAPALLAEDVYLKNGRVFRGVIATVEDGMVRIEMPGGTLSFPVSSILRIEASDAAYREYQGRRDRLAQAGAQAADWLELARWAKTQGLEPAAREAALEAGRLNPAAPGVRAFLADLGFVYDESNGSFLSFEESMARKGMVYDGGTWITNAEREARRARLRERDEAVARAEQAEAEHARVAEYNESVEPDDVVGVPLYGGYYGGGYYGGGYYGGGYVPGVGRPGRPGGGRGPGNRPGIGPPGGGLQPGAPSQLPAQPTPPGTGGSNRGRLQPMNIAPPGASARPN